MSKLFALIVVFSFIANNCFAIELELSDVITQAREAAKLEKKHPKEEIKPVSDVLNKNNKQELISKEEKIEPEKRTVSD